MAPSLQPLEPNGQFLTLRDPLSPFCWPGGPNSSCFTTSIWLQDYAVVGGWMWFSVGEAGGRAASSAYLAGVLCF